MIRRRGGQPRQLKQTNHAVLDTLCALVPRAPQAPPLQRLCWPSWWPGARALHGTATSRPFGTGSNPPGFTALPPKPAELIHFLATRAEADTGSAQAKMRICAIDAASQLAGVPSPSGDATVGAFRRGVRRVKYAAAARYAGCSAAKFSCLKCRRNRLRAPRGARGDERYWAALAPGDLACRIGPGAGRGRSSSRAVVGRHGRVTMTLTMGSWGTSCSRTGGQSSPSLGPNATAVVQASPPPFPRPPSPVRAPHCSWTRCGALWRDCSLQLRRCGATAGGPHPRFRRRRAGPSSSRAGGHDSIAGRRAGSRPSPLLGRHASRSSDHGCSGTARRPACPLHARLPGARHQDLRTAGEDAFNFWTHSVRQGVTAAHFHAGVYG